MVEDRGSRRVRRLRNAAWWWIEILKSVAWRMGNAETALSRPNGGVFESKGEDPLVVEYRALAVSYLADAYFLASALAHIKRYLDQLAKDATFWTSEVAAAGNVFREAYERDKLKDLRDVIEHADEHIAEEKMDIAADLDGAIGLQFGEDIGPMDIVLFGNRYKVRDALDAAWAVQPYLRDPEDSP